MLRTLIVTLGLALCAGPLASCSRSGAHAQEQGIQRLTLLPSKPEPIGREVVAVGRVPWPTEPDRVVTTNAEPVALPDDSPLGPGWLNLRRKDRRANRSATIVVSLKQSFDPATFNKLVLPIQVARPCFVRAVLYVDGQPIIGSENRPRVEPTTAESGPISVVLRMPTTLGARRQPDELRLSIDGDCANVQLGPIELCSQPPWAWLPALEDGFDIVSLDQDGRSAVGLSSARSLEAQARVGAGSELRFSVGIPRALRIPTSQPELTVRVESSSDEPLIQRVPLETEYNAPTLWHKVRIPLDSLAGQDIRIEFSFSSGPKGRPAVCAITRPRLESPKAKPRTVLLVTSDTHRADHIGAAGAGNGVRTPTIDALARRGVLFEDCWSSTNVTLPSHAAILTGTPPRDIGVFDNFTRLNHDARTLAEVYQQAGFATYAVVSAAHMADAESGLGQGFDRLSAPTSVSKQRSNLSIAQMSRWIDDADGQDLFLWLHLFDAHTPYEPPPEFERMYWPADRDPKDPSLPEPRLPSTYRVNLPEGVRDLEFLSARYRGEVTHVDEQLASILEIPRIAAGVVALTADHGESLGEHGIYWEHAGLYPQSIHVPLVLAFPGAPAGQRIREPVFQLDLGRTLLDLSGETQAEFPGSNLLAAREGPPEPRFAISSQAERASVTKDGWHLVLGLRAYPVNVDGVHVGVPKHRVELFDLSTDPKCERDLAKTERERAAALRALLCAWLGAARPTGWAMRAGTSFEMAQHLAQLGYTSHAEATHLPSIAVDCACEECAPFQLQR